VQLTTRPLADWKTYLRFRVLRSASPYLAAPFEEEAFHFNSTVLRGTPAMEPRWQRSARVVDSEIGEALGQLYVAQYYPPAAQARMAEMIANIVAVMHDRLQKLDWMTEATRKKALAKFDRFYSKIGPPGEMARLFVREHPEGKLLRQRARRDDVRGQAQARPLGPARRQVRMGHDAPDGERLLRPDPPTTSTSPRAFCSRPFSTSRSMTRELRWHRRRHRPRDHPRFRRPGPALRW